jgi:hypothetical protein
MLEARKYHRNEASERYLKNEKWKCKNSPSGAHIWQVTSDIKKGMMIMSHICKICNEKKLVLKKVY